jgi:hypothetical protein
VSVVVGFVAAVAVDELKGLEVAYQLFDSAVVEELDFVASFDFAYFDFVYFDSVVGDLDSVAYSGFAVEYFGFAEDFDSVVVNSDFVVEDFDFVEDFGLVVVNSDFVVAYVAEVMEGVVLVEEQYLVYFLIAFFVVIVMADQLFPQDYSY